MGEITKVGVGQIGQKMFNCPCNGHAADTRIKDTNHMSLDATGENGENFEPEAA